MLKENFNMPKKEITTEYNNLEKSIANSKTLPQEEVLNSSVKKEESLKTAIETAGKIKNELETIYDAQNSKNEVVVDMKDFEKNWQIQKPTLDTGNKKLRVWRNRFVAMITPLIMFGSAKASDHEGDKGKVKQKEKIENTTAVRGLVFYKGGIEKTPTGKDNAFNKNNAGLTEEDVYKTAQELGFRTDNNINFQTDLFSYLQKHNPKAFEDMLKEYGLPKAGTPVDDMIGVRTLNALGIIKNTPKDTPKETPAKTVEKKELRKYEGTSVFFPTPYSSGAGALVGFFNESTRKFTPIAPEDYERFAVPGYAKTNETDKTVLIDIAGVDKMLKQKLGAYYQGVETTVQNQDEIVKN